MTNNECNTIYANIIIDSPRLCLFCRALDNYSIFHLCNYLLCDKKRSSQIMYTQHYSIYPLFINKITCLYHFCRPLITI